MFQPASMVYLFFEMEIVQQMGRSGTRLIQIDTFGELSKMEIVEQKGTSCRRLADIVATKKLRDFATT